VCRLLLCQVGSVTVRRAACVPREDRRRSLLARSTAVCALDVGVVALLVEVVAELLGAGGVAQFGHRLGFDLSDVFSGEPVEVAYLIERAWLAVGESESQLDDVGLPLGERG